MKKTKTTKKIFAFALGALALSSFVLPSTSRSMGASMPFMASAQTVVKNFDSSMIEYDLADIDLDSQYPKDTQGKTDVIRFQEYMYSESDAYANSYGLYLYIYNPTEKPIRAMGNVANMAISYGRDGKPADYENVALTLLDKTNDNRFLKFKVTDAKFFLEHAKIYASANDGARRYDVAGVQLYYADGSKAQDAKVAKTYTWTGYAKGLDGESAEGATLSCTPLETLDFKVKQTYFRPKVVGEGSTSVKSLHSVYFSIPDNKIEEYGELVAVKASYLNAVLNPILVNGDKASYEAIQYHLGSDFTSHHEELNFQVVANLQKADIAGFSHQADYAFNYDSDIAFVYTGQGFDATMFNAYSSKELPYLYMMFEAETGNADTYTVNSKTLQEAMLATSSNATNTIKGAEGEYNADIFESIDSEYTTKTLTKDDKFTLTADISVQNKWWEKVFNMPGTTETMSVFSGISAIYEVKDTDITGNKSQDCSRLKIAESDYDDFCEAYNQAKEKEETLYLYRYQISDYESKEATIMQELDSLAGAPYMGRETWSAYSTNAYFFKQTVNLDFDVISVTMEDEDGATLLAVVADPIDYIPDGTNPNDTKPDKPSIGERIKNGCAGCNTSMPWWGWLLLIVGVLLVLLAKRIFSVFGKILKGVWYVVASPYYFVRWIVRLIRGDDE